MIADIRGGCELTFRPFLTVCFCHSSPPFRAPTFSHSVYRANENRAYFPVLVVLDSQMRPALQLCPLLFPAALAPQKVCPVSLSRWRRLVSSFFRRARLPCENRGSSSVGLHFPVLPKYL